MLRKGITSDSQKRGLLLHTAGLKVQDVYFTLVPHGEDRDYPTTLLRYQMMTLFLKLMYLSRDTCFGKLLKVARRLFINSSVGCDNVRPHVTLGTERTSTSETS